MTSSCAIADTYFVEEMGDIYTLDFGTNAGEKFTVPNADVLLQEMFSKLQNAKDTGNTARALKFQEVQQKNCTLQLVIKYSRGIDKSQPNSNF